MLPGPRCFLDKDPQKGKNELPPLSCTRAAPSTLQSVNTRRVVPGASPPAPHPRVPSHALAQRRGDAALRGGGRELPPAVFAAASQENPTGMVPGLALTQGPPVPPPALVVAGATGKHKECCSAKGSVMSFIGNTSRRSEMCYSNVFWTSW